MCDLWRHEAGSRANRDQSSPIKKQRIQNGIVVRFVSYDVSFFILTRFFLVKPPLLVFKKLNLLVYGKRKYEAVQNIFSPQLDNYFIVIDNLGAAGNRLQKRTKISIKMYFLNF